MEPITAFYNQLNQPARVVITTHQKPDPDAMGSSLGLYHLLTKLGHEVTVISPTNWASWLNWMDAADKVIDFEANREKSAKILEEASLLFCLDFNVLSRTKNLTPLLENFQGTRILIDHHQQPAVDSFHYGVSDTSKSSTCEMIFDLVMDSGNEHLLDEKMAECLYAGVMADTGSFRFSSAHAGVHRMVAVLKDNGLNHTKVHENIYDNFLENRLRFIGYVLMNRMEIYYEYNIALIAITKKDLLRFQVKTGDTEGLVNYPLSIQGIKMAALVIDRDEERKWSFRSKGNFDVNTFARQYFNGGGHFNASGGRSSESLEQTVEDFKKAMVSYTEQIK